MIGLEVIDKNVKSIIITLFITKETKLSLTPVLKRRNVENTEIPCTESGHHFL